MPEFKMPPNLKTLTWSVKTEDIDADARTLVVIISTDAKDRDDEVVLPSGLRTDNYVKNPVVLWAHDYRSLPIARALWVKPMKDAVKAKVQFADYEWAKLCFDLYVKGYLSAWSIGFIPVDGKSRQPTEDDLRKRPDWAGVRRIFEECELLEFSAVPVPSNPEALRLALDEARTKGVKLPEHFAPAAPPSAPQTGTPPPADLKILTPKAPAPRAVTILEPKAPAAREIKVIGTVEEVETTLRARLRGRVSL